MFQGFLATVAPEVVEYLEGETKRIHLLVTFATFGLSRHGLNSLPQGLVRILGDLGVHRDGHVRHPTGKQLLTYPPTALDRVGVKIRGVGDEPGGVS